MNDKYKMFKNFMFNELDISKDDIRKWVHEAVHEEVRKIVDNSFGRFSLDEFIKQQLTQDFFGERPLRQEVVREVGKQVLIKLKELNNADDPNITIDNIDSL